ncbi:MAG TPA: hypothetical protein VG345_14930, partial [Bryobacteraceae bacterium]|nr:hypothetical protein [Bryobacteraceae bacterium]
MTRRDFIETAALPAAAAWLARPASGATPEYKMGIATTSFSGAMGTPPQGGRRGSGAGAAGPRPGGGARPPADTMAFLEKCHALGAGGIQSALGGDLPQLRAKAEEYGMWIEGMAQIPRNGDMAALERSFASARDVGATLIRTGMLSGRRY